MHVRTMIKADYSHTRNPNEDMCTNTCMRRAGTRLLKASAPHQQEGEDTRHDHVVAEHGCDKKLAFASQGDKTTLSLREQ